MKRQYPRALQDERGVTLIELMIVVVIIGILAMIAYPNYTRWIVETRRSDAHIALSQMANDLQKFYSECGTYTDDILNTPRSCTTPSPNGTLGKNSDLSPKEHYQLSIALTASGYTITAAPQGKQATDDTECGSLTLDHIGQTGATGSDPSRCWKD